MIYEVIIIFLLILLSITIFNRENFTKDYLYENSTSKTINNSVFTDINKFINNSIFIDNQITKSKNNITLNNKDYNFFAFAINPYYNFKFLLFEKYYKNNLFDYYLIIKDHRYKDPEDNLSLGSELIVKLPPRDKIYLNDIIFIKNYGYYKIII